MEFKQLSCFIAAAEELNFTAAADRLYLSQPSLSRHIRNLEDELGLILFTRDKKNVMLTDAGLQLLATARDIANSASELQNSARELTLGRTGKLRIGYQGSAGFVVPAILDRYLAMYPNIDVILEEFGARILVQKLCNSELDLAIAFSVATNGITDANVLKRKKVFEDDLTLFTGQRTFDTYQKLIRAEHRRLRLRDFSSERMLMISRDINPGYYDYLQNLYLNSGLAARYPDRQPTLLSTLMLLVKANIGAALLPRTATLTSHPGCPYFDLEDVRATLQVEALWNAGNYNPSLKLLVAHLREEETVIF